MARLLVHVEGQNEESSWLICYVSICWTMATKG